MSDIEDMWETSGSKRSQPEWKAPTGGLDVGLKLFNSLTRKKVSAQQYVGNPIHCRHQSIHDGNFQKYMDEVCWVTNTYYVPEGEVFLGKQLDEYQRINYYQWVPMVLLVQALMFYLPHLFWQGMLARSGIDVGSIVSTGIQVHTAENTEEREKKVRFIARQLDGYLTHYQQMEETGCFSKFSHKIFQCLNKVLCGKRSGSYLVLLFMITKLLYLANAIGQFFLLERFLSSDIHAYGWNVFKSLISGGDWPQAAIFPKSTFCRFSLHTLDAIHSHTVQCVLPVNFFHDKLYILIWFWLVIIAIANGLSFIFWIARFVFRVDRVRFVNHHLMALQKISSGKKQASYEFISDYLKQDGVFILRLINLNVSGLVCARLAGEMWDEFKRSVVGRGFHESRRNTESEGFAEV